MKVFYKCEQCAHEQDALTAQRTEFNCQMCGARGVTPNMGLPEGWVALNSQIGRQYYFCSGCVPQLKLLAKANA